MRKSYPVYPDDIVAVDPATDTTADSQSRPRRAARAAVVASALGAVAAAGVTLAPGAEARQAAAHTVWDKVAGCESDNDWHIDTGNGFYGGLQFDDHTWHAYGGGQYAGQANKANRNEQIEVARRVLDAQGRGAWPSCGPQAGLTRHNGHATGKKVPDHAKPPPGQQKDGSKPAKHSSPHAASGSSHKGKHRAGETYTVKSGDTLRKIAHSHHVSGGWKAIYHTNKSHMTNPNMLHVGQHLALP